MLVEIPDPEVIFGVIIAFLVGLGGLYLFYKVKPLIESRKLGINPEYLERLEYYERQLIDMKIRLDALNMEELTIKSTESIKNIKPVEDIPSKIKEQKPIQQKVIIEKPLQEQIMPNIAQNNMTDYVLRLITDKAMTSRDVQITLNRSREHTSRLMKKLFEDGFVERNINTKPYTYSITRKGREKIGLLEPSPQVV